MSFILLGILNSQAIAGITYWLATLGDTEVERGYSLALDSSDNILVNGSTSSIPGVSSNFFFSKHDSIGTTTWQRSLGGSSADDGKGNALTSTNDSYFFGTTYSSGAGEADFLLAKYNSSGVIQWQRVLGGSGTEDGYGIGVDSSDNAYVTGFTSSTGAGDFDALVAKYNSSGVIQWQRVIGGTGREIGYGAAVDSSDNVYVSAHSSSSGAGGPDLLLVKYNSSGTVQWQRTLGGTGGDVAQGVSVDSSDNVYVGGYAFVPAVGNHFLIAKYNSSGTLQWQRTIGLATSGNNHCISFDSLDNVYLIGETSSQGAGGADFLIVKYNSSGVIQWQRTLGSTGSEEGRGISVNSQDDLVLVGFTSAAGEGSRDVLIATLPSDGSLTGTYVLDGVNMVYAASTLTSSTSSFTAATSSLTAATSSLTSSTSTLTDSSTSFTSHFVEIPA